MSEEFLQFVYFFRLLFFNLVNLIVELVHKFLVKLIDENRNEFDGFIERYSHGWKVDRISKTALAVLRCALCEIIYMDDIPDSAAINEAVELDKGYDEPDTVAFVNGVLGGFMRGEKGATEAEAVTDAE